LKKKPTLKDLKIWKDFTESREPIENKDIFVDKKTLIQKIKKIDLHGFSLSEANKKIEQLVSKYYEEGIEKIVVITGKGLRSKTDANPYISKNFSMLKYSVPEFINTNENLRKKISSMSEAKLEDGGNGAFYIFLKKLRE
tara:strand:+ start:333 stop:752 length:420 start_codon:yes stop_codon:yes gene_type:complete